MGKGMRFAGIRLLISFTLRANAGKATFRGKTAGGNSSPKVGEVPERQRGMKQATLLIPLTRTGSSPTLGEQRHAECPNTGKPLLSAMRVVGTLKIMHFACLTDRRGCPPKVGGRAKRRGV